MSQSEYLDNTSNLSYIMHLSRSTCHTRVIVYTHDSFQWGYHPSSRTLSQSTVKEWVTKERLVVFVIYVLLLIITISEIIKWFNLHHPYSRSLSSFWSTSPSVMYQIRLSGTVFYKGLFRVVTKKFTKIFRWEESE